MPYIVDYRVGGMGNAIVAHIMYACDKVDLDCSSFFSVTGDSHNRRLFTNRTLQPIHMIEEPHTVPRDSTCIIEIKATGWTKILEFIMGWRKYHKQVPGLDNFKLFYSQINRFNHNDQRLWKEFYNNIRDPSWPECSSYGEVPKLPKFIQQEVYANYQKPVNKLIEDNFVELISIALYDHLCNDNSVNPRFNGEVLLLQDYLDGDMQILEQQAVRHLGWEWNRKKSLEFYCQLIEANKMHLDWLANLQQIFYDIVNERAVDCDLEPFEQALLIAKLCRRYQIHPAHLPWTNTWWKSTQGLINVFQDY